MNSIRKYLENNHQKLVNILSIFSYLVAIPATILGIWFTYYSIENTSTVVEKQLQEQKKATSIIVVGDFLSGLTDRIVAGESGKNKMSKFDKVTITRTQLLIDTLDFPDLSAQVIVFLGANDFGYLFDSNRDPADKFIDIANINLSYSSLGNISLIRPNFYCSDLIKTSIHGSSMADSKFNLSNLQESKFVGATFDNAVFQWTNFQGAYMPSSSFKDAKILFSDLRNIRIYSDSAKTRDEEVQEIREILSETKSLYGSLVDQDVKDSLMENGGKRLFTDISLASGLGKQSLYFQRTKETYEENKSKAENRWSEEWKSRRAKRCKLRGI